MPIPFLALGAIGAAALFGGANTIGAVVNQHDANETNKEAQRIANNAVERANKCRTNSGNEITALGETKIYVLNRSVIKFIDSFEKLKNVELDDSTEGMEELKKFAVDQQSFTDLRELGNMASSIAAGAASGATLGAVTAFGAYSAVKLLGTAGTGIAINALGGAAATNATLAFLGGGTLAAGGLGMAGGTMVLGGLVAAPALAVFGAIANSKASANRDSAYANLAEARKYEEEMKTIQMLCKAIYMRAAMYNRVLLRLNALLEPQVENLEALITEHGTDFSAYTKEQKKSVAVCAATVKAVKTVLDTPLLTEDGKLTEESATLSDSVQKLISPATT